MKALEKLCKWHTVFAGWQLGTRPKGDPECDAVRDHRELTILLRAEVSALTALMVEKKIFTEEEWSAALNREAALLDRAYERKFPGIKATEDGLDIDVVLAAQTMKGWRP